jgi:hypothetical protein
VQQQVDLSLVCLYQVSKFIIGPVEAINDYKILTRIVMRPYGADNLIILTILFYRVEVVPVL